MITARQKSELYFVAALALLISSLLCAVSMRMGWLDDVARLQDVQAHCPACYMLFSVTMLDPAAAMTIGFVARAMLAGIMIFSLSAVLIRWWKSRRFAARLASTALSRPPPRTALVLADTRLAQDVDVIPSEQPRAFCYGLLKPRICISTGLVDFLTDAELKAVLWHERHHQLTHAPLRFFVADALSGILFFVPLVGEWRDWLVISTELAADRYAARMGGRPALASALYRLLDHPLGTSQPLGIALAGLSVTHVRIAELLGERVAPRRVSSRSLMLLILA